MREGFFFRHVHYVTLLIYLGQYVTLRGGAIVTWQNRTEERGVTWINAGTYEATDREQSFLSGIESPKYEREIINGLKPFFQEQAPEDMKNFYSPQELQQLDRPEWHRTRCRDADAGEK